MKKEYSIETFETEHQDDDYEHYSVRKVTKVITDDLASELEKLTNENTRKINVKILRQYADELKEGNEC